MRDVIMTGKTVEAAIELALEELGLLREEVSVEIIDMPEKKLFKNIPAKVKVTADVDYDRETAAKAKVEKEMPHVPPQEPVKAKAPQPAVQPPCVIQKEPVAAPVHVNTKDEDAVPMDIETSEKAKLAVSFLSEICAKMGVENIKITAEKRGEVIILKIDGPSVGALIGHRGETMEALSYLSGLVANHLGGDYSKIGLDVGGYRSKREDDLAGLAKRVAAKVIKTGRSQSLEPMNPYERRIIHSSVSEIEGIKSESTGEGASRRVVIISTGANAKNALPERFDRPVQNAYGSRPRTNGYQGSSRGPRPPYAKSEDKGARRPSGGFKESSVPPRSFKDRVATDAAPIVPKRTETVSDGDFPLYGKIEL